MKDLYIRTIAGKLSVREWQVENCVKLFEDGATIPFISRYRKEKTGGLDDVAVAEIRHWADVYSEMDKRKESMLSTIREAGKLTPELEKAILDCVDSRELEDLYLPFRPKRRTRATVAKEAGLEPLAEEIFDLRISDPQKEARKFVNDNVPTPEDALAGARDIIAEKFNETASVRETVRRMLRTRRLVSRPAKKADTPEASKYKGYFDFSESLSHIASHRLLAVLRAENEGYLNLKLDADPEKCGNKLYYDYCQERKYPNEQLAGQIRSAIDDAYRRLLEPSISNEVIKEAKEKADIESVKVFGENLRQLLLAPPVGQKKVLAIDPGFRTGCKVVCLDAQGNLLHYETIFPHPPSEDGASIYSASEAAREEFPDYDVTVRGAVSIGRRLMDPLAELVKIDPKSLGVGQYQHDVDQALLKEKLDNTVESCVNSVGVNVNTASRHLLSYVAGIGPALAENIVQYRTENGPFKSRKDLLKVKRLGEKAFEQCAGFLRIPGAANPLDNSAVHPEAYHIVGKMASSLGVATEDLVANAELCSRIKAENFVEADFGLPTVNDIIRELVKPGRDPRESAVEFSFSDEIHIIEDLSVGMELPGIVTNITAFGAFVDIGIKQNGLIHVSQMGGGKRRIQNPAEVLRLHQHVKVQVLSVDTDRNRIGLKLLR